MDRRTHGLMERPMSELDEIRPKSRQRVMDLVQQAGVDVSHWGDFRGGEAKAATNPKHCYEWSFVEEGKVVVLNLWFESLRVKNGIVVQDHNLRQRAGG